MRLTPAVIRAKSVPYSGTTTADSQPGRAANLRRATWDGDFRLHQGGHRSPRAAGQHELAPPLLSGYLLPPPPAVSSHAHDGHAQQREAARLRDSGIRIDIHTKQTLKRPGLIELERAISMCNRRWVAVRREAPGKLADDQLVTDCAIRLKHVESKRTPNGKWEGTLSDRRGFWETKLFLQTASRLRRPARNLKRRVQCPRRGLTAPASPAR